MCGIVGYLGSNDYKEYIMSGLKLLQNRGYDSVGVCFSYNNKLEVIKYASADTHDSLEKLENSIKSLNYTSTCAIGHTRWATHGGKTDINAHPHYDNKERVAIVHNGIIENFQDLKTNLINKGYFFKSQTDTEVIAVLIGHHLDNGDTTEQAIKNTIEQLRGTWAIVVMHCNYPNKLWITRNGSPILLGMEDDYIMVVSEQIAFNKYIKKYVVLDNNDLVEVTKKETITYTENINKYHIQKIKNDIQTELKPTGYTHWMLKEIMEQPDAVIRAINNGGRIENNSSVKLGGLETNKETLMQLSHIVLLGCGTSYHAALWSSVIFKKLKIFDTVSVYDGAEFDITDIPKSGKTGIILLSQSGETKDLHRCIQIAKNNNLFTIGVVNVTDSLIARECICGVYLNAGREVAVASTKSFTSQCVVLTLIAVWFSQIRETENEMRKQLINDLHKLSLQIQSITTNVNSIMSIVDNITHSKTIFLLGKGKEEAIARESALKIKEVAYIHAEGYSTSALKHGPFALIENNTPIIIFDISDEQRDKNKNAYEEVKARNAYIIKISDKEGDLMVERNKTFGGVLANVYIQLISYFIALKKNNNPDYPRNLAKVVTVE